MTFTPVIPTGGNLGWSFLRATKEAQQSAFANSAVVTRDVDYFVEKIGSVRSAEQLVSDRRLLSVTLGAFGLGDDINNRFFIKKVLEDGTLDPEAFANRLADKRYLELAKAFSFDLSPPNTVLSDFAATIVEAYKMRGFEVAVGQQDESLRLVLSLERELGELAESGHSEDTNWFTVMGTPPLRAVFERALGLPSQTGALDIDRQLEAFREKAMRAFGESDPAAFANPELRETLERRFLLQTDLQASVGGGSAASVALSLLQQQPRLF